MIGATILSVLNMLAEEGSPPRMAGVVTYTDWSHIWLGDPRQAALNLDHLFGVEGVRQIIETSRAGGLSKLYWRTAGSGSSFYPTRFDTDGDGEPDLPTKGAYDMDTPPYRPIYVSEALTPDHIRVIPQSADAPSFLRLNLDANAPSDFAVRLLAKVTPSQGSAGPFLYITEPGSPTTGFALDALGKFRVYRVRAGEKLRVEGHEVAAVEFPQIQTKEREIGIYWPPGCRTEVAVHALQVISSPRIARDCDAPADIKDLDLGPVVPGMRDTAWRQDLAADNLAVKETFGDPRRRDDFARAYQSPNNPFGKGEDLISVAVREAHAAGMKIYLWFTISEENHYGGGPIGAFTRRHPDWREVDKDGNIWRARLSLAFPEVRRFKVEMVKEAVERYKPDGVLLDFVRRGLRDPFHEEGKTTHYPVRDEQGFSIFGYDTASLGAFAEAHKGQPRSENGSPEWINWRVANQTRLISELHEAIPGVPMAVAVFSGSAEDTRRGDLLDWKAWAENGLIQEIMFILDHSTDGRPFVRPFGLPPAPIESVGKILAERKKELPENFPAAAGIYCYNIKADTIPLLSAQVQQSGVGEIAWWETTALEYAEGYSNKAWRQIKHLADSFQQPKPNKTQ